MTNVTHNYETVMVLNTQLGEEAVKALVEKFTGLISANSTDVSVEEWGNRKLAYEINYLKEGYYVLVNFTCEAEFPAELDRVYKITEGVIRSIIIRK